LQVSKLEVKTKGTGIAGVPAPLLKYLINSFVPPRIKAALQAAVPVELGILLALHADHHVALKGEISVQSLPLETFVAPLELARELPQPGPAAAARDARSVPEPVLSVRSLLKEVSRCDRATL
jgi:hypothetical protein